MIYTVNELPDRVVAPSAWLVYGPKHCKQRFPNSTFTVSINFILQFCVLAWLVVTVRSQTIHSCAPVVPFPDCRFSVAVYPLSWVYFEHNSEYPLHFRWLCQDKNRQKNRRNHLMKFQMGPWIGVCAVQSGVFPFCCSHNNALDDHGEVFTSGVIMPVGLPTSNPVPSTSVRWINQMYSYLYLAVRLRASSAVSAPWIVV